MERRSTRSMKKSISLLDDVEASKPVSKSRATRKSIIRDADSGSSESDEDIVIPKPIKTPKKKKRKITDSSSSESDIENYLKPIDEIDLNSSFFKSDDIKDDISSFNKIEKEIFSDIKVTRLSDSDSSEDEEIVSKNLSKEIVPNILVNDHHIGDENEHIQSLKEGEKIALLNFQKLQDYSKKIEEAKRSVELYQAKQTQENVQKEQVCEEKINIENLLAIGEAKNTKDDSEQDHSISSADKHTGKQSYSDSEQEDWEEINESQDNEGQSLIPQKELEITVEMPSNMKKKKGNDLLAAVKRRLNRIRKENQVLIHKVHLLCWIAHGNYVNSILSDQGMLSLGLSLMPSEKSFPSGRIDLGYLEQILKWFNKTVKLVDRTSSKNSSLEELLIEQFTKKEAYSKSMLAMIFILTLRSLGIQCRLVLSLQVEPLRPPNSDLHFTGSSSGSKEGDIEKIKQTEHKKTILKVSNSTEKLIKEEKNDKASGSTINLGKLKTNLSSGEKKKDSSKSNGPSVKKQMGKRSKDSLDVSEEKRRDSKRKPLKDEVQGTSKYFKETGTKRNETSTKLNDKTDDEKSKSGSDSKKVKSKGSEPKEDSERKINLYQKNSEKSSRQSQGRKETSKAEKEVEPLKKKNSGDNVSKKNKNETKAAKDNVQDNSLESKRVTRSKSKSPSVDSSQNVRSKSTSTLKVRLERIDENQTKSRSKSSSSSRENTAGGKKIPQLDGMDDSTEFKGFEKSPNKKKTTDIKSFEEFYTQIYDKVSNEPSSSKTNLKNLKAFSSPDDENCKSRKHRRSVKKPSYVEKITTDSEDDFEESPRKKIRSSEKVAETKVKKHEKKVNLQKLKSSKPSKVESSKNISPRKVLDVKQDIMNLIKGRISEQKHIDKSKMVKKRKPPKNESDSEDSDYVPEPIKKKYHDSDDEFYPKMKVKKRVQVKEEVKKIKKKKPKDSNSRRVISSDSEYTEEEIVTKKEEPVKKKRGCDTWIEVFLEMEEKWISVDVVRGQAHCVNELYSRASHPVSYVLAWNNNGHIKDITRRYCQNYNTVTRKLRTDAQWWEASLKPYLGPKNARDREEDDELDRQQQEKPLPTTISEYKNHPLYALERHLLKFEALYPPNAIPLGYVRNEPVYSRDCVFVCHSRDIWLKEAKVVKRKEQPYKIVKARPKYDKLSNTMITDQMLEIFGPWQVEDYDPPTAENGMVPRNAFGNVDLFKPSMLPKKCVHLRLPGLNKTARRLNIDCASAIVGFDFHGGWSHPVYDGFIVCEEFEDELVAAWNIEQEEQEKKEQEKYEKRVYGNWKKLFKGLMIRERLKSKYGFGQNENEDADGSSALNEKRPKVAVKKKRRCISDSSEEDEDEKIKE